MKDALRSWDYQSLINEKGDFARALRLFKVALLAEEVYRMKKLQCNGNSDCETRLRDTSFTLHHKLDDVKARVILKYDVPEYDSDNQSPEEFIKELGTDAKKKELAKMILWHKNRL